MIANCKATVLALVVVGSLTARLPADEPVAARLAADLSPAVDCATPLAAPAVCQPKIIYHHVARHRVGCCLPPIENYLEVQDPAACGCPPVLIPVCLPGCCSDVPQVSTHCGLFGRGVVRYDYCCGLSIKILFRHSGDIVVTYIGA